MLTSRLVVIVVLFLAALFASEVEVQWVGRCLLSAPTDVNGVEPAEPFSSQSE